MRIQTYMKRRKEIWPRLWMALLLWVLLGRAVVMPSFAAEEHSLVGSSDTDTFEEGYEEDEKIADESEDSSAKEEEPEE